MTSIRPHRHSLTTSATPVQAYLEFALAAPAILFPTLDGEYRPFGEWLSRANPTAEEWQDHLSTLSRRFGPAATWSSGRRMRLRPSGMPLRWR